ncbi:MAG: hypothetical protein PHW87_10190 [Methanothrix sp.]|nr:hypothetical protein [Methanothrix sp.]
MQIFSFKTTPFLLLAAADAEVLKLQVRLEDLTVWQMVKVKESRKGSKTYSYWKELSAICLVSLTIMLAVPAVSASNASISDLKSTVSAFEDAHMNAEDLAFYLATHNFDAKPNGGHVDVNLGCSICKLTPNGSAPGLCSIEI